MKTKKLQLLDLRVKSFVTHFQRQELAVLRGGEASKSTGPLTEGANCIQLLPSESQCDGPLD